MLEACPKPTLNDTPDIPPPDVIADSFSTWVLVGTWLLATVATRHTVLVSGSAWVLCTLALNEGLFKKLLGAPRPDETCLYGNFVIILGRLSRIHSLCRPPHAPCGVR